jgi:hypothetical protein
LIAFNRRPKSTTINRRSLEDRNMEVLGVHPVMWALGRASVVFTPLGTQIFIPGYMSLDPKRDFDFARIGQLHRARGVARQGPALLERRQSILASSAKARRADAQARDQGLKGDARYSYIAEALKLPIDCDFRQIRKLLSK